MKTIIILAGNHREFMDWLSENGSTEQKAVFARDRDSLMGVEAYDTRAIGTFWSRKDAGELYDLARTRIR